LVQAAQKLGFAAQAVKGPYDALAQVSLPAIAHVRTADGLGHFVVLYKATRKGALVADPARSVLKLSKDDFCRQWTGYLLLLTPQPAQLAAGSGTPCSPSRRLFGLLGWQVPFLADAFVCVLLMTLLGVTTSFFIQQLVDNVLVRHDVRLLNALG